MSCNCKVGEKIDYIHKKYGEKVPVSKKTNIKFIVGNLFTKLGLSIILIPAIPVMVLHVLVNKGKAINITNLVKLANVRK